MSTTTTRRRELRRQVADLGRDNPIAAGERRSRWQRRARRPFTVTGWTYIDMARLEHLLDDLAIEAGPRWLRQPGAGDDDTPP
jgi:hypothetical protein